MQMSFLSLSLSLSLHFWVDQQQHKLQEATSYNTLQYMFHTHKQS